jgi:Regulator of chromosome condensation (RCC1) repeat
MLGRPGAPGDALNGLVPAHPGVWKGGLLVGVLAAISLVVPTPRAMALSPVAEAAAGAIATPGTVAAAVSAGGDHGCAVRNDGTLACWGRNLEGQASRPRQAWQQRSCAGVETARDG